MLVTLLVDPSEKRREQRMDALRRAGFAVAGAMNAEAIVDGVSPDAVVLAQDVSLSLRDAVIGRVGPVPVVRDDGDDDGLIAALRQVAADARPLIQLGDTTVDLRTRSVLRDGRVTTLSDKESALLAWLLARNESVVPRSELLVNVWGYHPDSTSRTVDVTLGRLRDKVEREPKHPEFVLTVRGAGYRLVGAQAGAVQTRVARAAPEDVYGRDDDLQRIADVLQRGRVVTLLGPPGIGKTTLGRALLASTDGVFVELADATTHDGVRVAMCRALGLPHHDVSAERVVAALAASGAQVVVLDNAEQVTGPLVDVFHEWTGAGADVAWLVTTRLRLKVGSERIVDIRPLDEDAAVALFLARARARRPGYARPEADAVHVRGLVTDLECIPLALELAAARTRLFTPRALRERIHRSLSVLRDDRRDRAERQQTLAAAVAWSWDLLTPAEKYAMMRLSVVVGGIDVADAEVLVEADDADPIGVLEALVDHSLAQVSDVGRLTQLVSVRAFARAKLCDNGEEEVALRRHAAVFSERAAEWAAQCDGPDAWDVAHVVERDRANLTQALRWLTDSRAIAQVIGALQVVWDLSGVAHADLTTASDALVAHPGPGWVDGAFHLSSTLANTGRVPEAVAWFERVKDQAVTPSQRMRVLFLEAQEASRRGDMEVAESLYEQACQVPADDPGVYGRALISRIVRYRATARIDQAVALAHEGLAWARARGVPTAELSLQVILASLHRLRRQHDASIAACEATLEVHRVLGTEEPIAQILGLIGMNLHESGRAEQALPVLDDAIERAGRLGLLRLNGRLLGVRSRAKWSLTDFQAALVDAEAALQLNLRCSDTVSAPVSRLAKGVALRELGLCAAALVELREAERLAKAVGAKRALSNAATERAITALAQGDVHEATDAISVGLAAAHAPREAVLHALSAMVQLMQSTFGDAALEPAHAAVRPNTPDRSAEGFVALVQAIAEERAGEPLDLTRAQRCLAANWEPAFSDALNAVQTGQPAQFAMGRIVVSVRALPGV